jgi:exopolysaccharide transport family protein
MTADDQTGDLRSIWFVLLRRSRVILGIAASVLLLSVFVVFAITPRYTSTAQILLDPRKSNIIGGEMIADAPSDLTAIDNQMALLQSRAFLAWVAEREKLLSDEEFGGVPQKSVLAQIRSVFSSAPGEGNAEAPVGSELRRAELFRSAGRLASAVTVERIGRTYILAIGVTSRSPEKAVRLANAIANAYIVDQLEARFESARRATEWLGDRLERLRNELRDSETAVIRFRAENNLGAVATGAVSESQAADINLRLVMARSETSEKKVRLDQAQRIIAEGGNQQAIPDVVRSPIMPGLKTQLGQISQREADLIARYGDRHPSIVNVRAEKQDVERQIRVETNRVLANLKNDYDIAKSRQDALEKSLGVLTGSNGIDNAIALKLRELERTAAANKALYESFLSRFKLSEEQANLEIKEVRIISPAAAPSGPSFPRRGLIVSLALAFGLAAGVGTAFLLEALSRGFTTPGEVEDMLELPTLASVPLLTNDDLDVDGRRLSPPAYLLRKPLSRFSEAIRSLRAGIQMSDVDAPPKVVQMTSVVAGEGKTTVAIAFAQSAATSSPRVLLIDCDLRRPAVTKLFKLEKRPGLVDLLMGTATGDRAIVRDTSSGIYVIGAGSSTQNPPDLLSSVRMQGLLLQLRDAYDCIVLDSPPVGPVVDAVVLAQAVDKAIFVIAWNETPRDMVAHAIKQLQGGKKVAGIVLNRVDTKQSTRYGGYYYSKYYEKYYKK